MENIVPAPTDPPVDAPTEPPVDAPGGGDTVEAIIRSLGQAEDFADGNYQKQALDWAVVNLPFGTDAATVREYYALLCIYYATNNVQNIPIVDGQCQLTPWNFTDGWLEPPSINSYCSWFGIACAGDGGPVSEINLYENLLTGNFPDEVNLLASSLKILDVSINCLANEGDKGTAWMGDMQNLDILNLESNYIAYFDAGGIPTSIARLSNLKELYLALNTFSGSLTEDLFAGLTSLQFMDISFNNFNRSQVPRVLGSLPDLKSVNIFDGNITGNLDFMIGSTSLEFVQLYDNFGLTGTIPTEIGDILSLIFLDVGGNELSGPIPSELGKLVNIGGLSFVDNFLTGTIPSELGQLTGMIQLSVEVNDITGTVPPEICLNRPDPLAELFTDCEKDTFTCDCCDCCGQACRPGFWDL